MLRRNKYDFSHVVNAKHKKLQNTNGFNTMFATWFYLGFSPIAPGTVGSLGAIPLFYMIMNSTLIQTYVSLKAAFYILAALTFLIGWWATAEYQEKTESMDHSSVVIDEVAGMMLTFALCFDVLFKVAKQFKGLLSITTHTAVVAFIIAFIAFRIFDIAKPFGISIIDRYVKNAFGVMLDDSVAAIYAALSIRAISMFLDNVL